MSETLLKGKVILTVDDEPDVLEILKEEISQVCDGCLIHQAATYDLALDHLFSYSYDLVILDIMGVRGFDLLRHAVGRNFPVVMLTAHALNPEALKQSIELGARAYLPKEKLSELVPFLEDVLRYEYAPGWKRLFEKLGGFFSHRFGADWQKDEATFWKEFQQKLAAYEGVILPKP